MKGYHNRCVVCGKTFSVAGSGAYYNKTCSPECWVRLKNKDYKKLYKFTCKSIKEKIRKKRCLVCGKFFIISGSGSGRKKICSEVCKRKRNNQFRDAHYKRNPLIKYEAVTKGCLKRLTDEELVKRLNRADIRLGLIYILIEERGLKVEYDGAKFVLIKKKV